MQEDDTGPPALFSRVSMGTLVLILFSPLMKLI